jgi:hypothetical protein
MMQRFSEFDVGRSALSVRRSLPLPLNVERWTLSAGRCLSLQSSVERFLPLPLSVERWALSVWRCLLLICISRSVIAQEESY